MFFSFTLRAEIIAASFLLAHADQLVIQMSGKVAIHRKLRLRFPLVSESPNENTGGRRYYLIPTSDFFYKLEDTGLNKGTNAAAVRAVDRIHSSLSKSKTLKNAR